MGDEKGFQSTRPRGARPIPGMHQIRVNSFQSTRPRGARRYGRTRHALDRRFNPRARVGRDLRGKVAARIARHVSIHAPAWGATFPQKG